MAALALLVVASAGCLENSPYPDPPPSLGYSEADPKMVVPPTAPDSHPRSLEQQIIRSMLYATAIEHRVNPNLVMALAWWESGWNQDAVSSAGAIGVMQVMPATADAAGPRYLHRHADVHDLTDNIELGTAILKANLDRYGNDLAKALVDYYAGPGAVRAWQYLNADERRYVWGVYHLAVAFRDGRGPA